LRAVITKSDLAVALILFVISFVYYPSNTKSLNPALYRGTLGQEIHQPDNWLFDADCASVTANMYDRYSDQTLNRRHPLFSIVMIPMTYATAMLSRRPRIEAAVLVFSLLGCLWAPIFYLALNALLADRIAAILFAIVGMSSASTAFWLSIPERHSLAGLSVVAGLLLLAYAQQTKKHTSALLGGSFFLTLGLTVTNCALAVFGCLARAGWKATARILFYAFGAMALVNVASSVYLPTGYFIGVTSLDQSYVRKPNPSHLQEVTRSFLLHSMVTPRLGIAEGYPVPVMSVQRSPAFSTGAPGTAATVAWILLLSTIPLTVFQLYKNESAVIVLGGYVVSQFALYCVYGLETFLYSVNYLPILIALAALGVKTRIRPLILALSAVIAVSAALNNAAQFRSLAEYTWTLK
jgi:MFS family permease